jgi:hypothetical protein
LRDNYPVMPIAEICAHLGRSYTAIQRQAERSGISKIGHPGSGWTEDEDELLNDLYGTLLLADLAEMLGRSPQAVMTRAMRQGANKRSRRAGILVRGPRPREDTVTTMRRDVIRHDYFAQVDSPVKAYVLGWLASDGNVKTDGNVITLRIAAEDEAAIQLVRDELAPLHKITYYKAPHGKKLMAAFAVTSRQMKQDLIQLGVTPNKSLTLQYPPILSWLDNSFLLGHFDGDGSLFKSGRAWRWTIISASPTFLPAVQDRIEGVVGIRPRGPHRHHGRNRAFHITVNGSNVGPVDAWLHADMPGLTRKRLPPGDYPRTAEEAAAWRKGAGRRRTLALYPLEKLEHARQLRAQGLSFQRIAEETGIKAGAVYRWLKHPALDESAA